MLGISLFDDGIIALCDGITHDSTLREINLTENQFTKRSSKAIGSMLTRVSHLERFTIGGTKIHLGTLDMKYLEDGLARSALKILNLHNLYIDLENAEILGRSLARMEHLENLTVSLWSMTSESWGVLWKQFHCDMPLKHLHVYDLPPLGGCHTFFEWIKSSHRLKEMHFYPLSQYYNQYRDNYTDFISGFTEALGLNQSLKKMCMAWTDITSIEIFRRQFQNIASNNSLETLQLNVGEQVPAKCLVEIFRALERNRTLTGLTIFPFRMGSRIEDLSKDEREEITDLISRNLSLLSVEGLNSFNIGQSPPEYIENINKGLKSVPRGARLDIKNVDPLFDCWFHF